MAHLLGGRVLWSARSRRFVAGGSGRRPVRGGCSVGVVAIRARWRVWTRAGGRSATDHPSCRPRFAASLRRSLRTAAAANCECDRLPRRRHVRQRQGVFATANGRAVAVPLPAQQAFGGGFAVLEHDAVDLQAGPRQEHAVRQRRCSFRLERLEVLASSGEAAAASFGPEAAHAARQQEARCHATPARRRVASSSASVATAAARAAAAAAGAPSTTAVHQAIASSLVKRLPPMRIVGSL